MNKKNIYLRFTIWLGLFVFLTLLSPAITFANQNHDLDEFNELELTSLDEQKKKSDKNKQRLILFNDNLYLLDDDFNFGEEEELELLKLELNPNDIEISREYEDFLNAFFENSKLIPRPSSAEKSIPPIIKNPPLIKEEKTNPPLKNKSEYLAPVEYNSFEKSNPPIIKQEKTNPPLKNKSEDPTPEGPSKQVKPPTKTQVKTDSSSTTTKNKITILPHIGFGVNYLASYNNIGPIFGGSFIYGINKWINVGADLMYIYIPQKDVDTPQYHTLAITGFNKINIIKNIELKVGLSFLKTGFDTSIGVALGAGLSFPIGKMLIIQPMVDANFASIENNIVGINLNIGIAL